jgi:hypothetical protein
MKGVVFSPGFGVDGRGRENKRAPNGRRCSGKRRPSTPGDEFRPQWGWSNRPERSIEHQSIHGSSGQIEHLLGWSRAQEEGALIRHGSNALQGRGQTARSHRQQPACPWLSFAGANSDGELPASEAVMVGWRFL